MKKNLFFFVLILLSVSVIFVIFENSSYLKKTGENEPKKITFWTLQLSSFSDYLNNVISEYEKTHPGIKINWVDVPYSEGEKRALAAVMSNSVPDLINMNPSFGATLASKGVLIDIKTLIDKEDFDKYLPESPEASTVFNILFGIPWYITSSVTVCNKNILNKSGITNYNSLKTYEDLGNIAPIIKEKTGKFVLMPNLTENGYILKIFNKYDIPTIDKTGQKTLFNTPEAVRILAFWKNMYNNGYIPSESITETHRASLEKYMAGETAFIIAGANFLKIIKENAPKIYKNSEVLPQITGSNGKSDFSLMNLVIPKKSKHPGIAADFALFLTNHKNQLAFCKSAPILPSIKETAESDFFKKSEKDDLLSKGRIISAGQLKNALAPLPQLQNQKDLNEIIDLAVQQVLLNEKTPEEVLNQAVTDWDKLLAE